MNVQRINDLQDRRLDPYRSLKITNQTRDTKMLIAEGTTLVERVLNSNYVVTDVLISEQKFVNFQSRIPTGTCVYVVPRELAANLVGYSFHSGVLCRAHKRPQPSLTELLNPNTTPSLILFGDRVIDQQNVGLIIRIAAAYGATAVLLNSGCADPFSRRVLRVSMGNSLQLPIIQIEDSAKTIQQLKTSHFHVCATSLQAAAVSVNGFKYASKTALIFGNETHGVCDDLLQLADSQLTIPMWNGTDSLNVSIAAGIFAHTFRQQHS